MGFFKKVVKKVKKTVSKVKKAAPRAGTAVLTGGISEIARAAGSKGLNKTLDPITGAVVNPTSVGQPGGLLGGPGKPNLDSSIPKDNTAAIIAASQQAKDDEEAKRRSRRNNILTRPLGALTSNAVLTRVLTGQ